MVDRHRSTIYDGIARGNVKLRPSEVPYYERIIEYIRENPGCTRQQVDDAVGTHSSTSILVAIAIQTGKVKASGHKPQKLEVIE